MDLRAIQQLTKKLAVDLGGGTISVEYFPSRITRRNMREIEERVKAVQEKIDRGEAVDDDEIQASAQTLVQVMAGWDLTDGDEKCPITVAFLVDELGYVLTNQILNAVVGDINPNSPPA